MNPGCSVDRNALRNGNAITSRAMINAVIFFFICPGFKICNTVKLNSPRGSKPDINHMLRMINPGFEHAVNNFPACQLEKITL